MATGRARDRVDARARGVQRLDGDLTFAVEAGPVVGHAHHDAQRVGVVVGRVGVALDPHGRRALERGVRARQVDALAPRRRAGRDPARRSSTRTPTRPRPRDDLDPPRGQALPLRGAGVARPHGKGAPLAQHHARVVPAGDDAGATPPRGARRAARGPRTPAVHDPLLAVRTAVGVVVIAVRPEIDVNGCVGFSRSRGQRRAEDGSRPPPPRGLLEPTPLNPSERGLCQQGLAAPVSLRRSADERAPGHVRQDAR